MLKNKKKERIIWKSRSLSYASIRWQVCQSARHKPSRESARIQINNLPPIFHFFFFFFISFCLWHCTLQNHALFFTTKTQFLSVSYSITDTNNSVPEELKRKQRNYHHITMLLLRWTKRAPWDVVQWTLTILTKPGFTAVDVFMTRYYDESGMYCVFILHVLMCTAYTNLANTFFYKLSIEKQRSVVDAWGLDLYNDI